METDLDRTIQRTKRYWYDDGLTEIAAGVVFLAIAALFWVETTLQAGWPAAGLSAFGLPVVVLAGSWLSSRVVTALKRRLTYPRTGFVAYQRPTARRRVVTAALAAVVALALVVLLGLLAPASIRWIPVLDGIAVGGFLVYIGASLGLTRFHALAVSSLAAGALASWRTADETVGSAAFFGLMGLALVVSGAVTLWGYLGRTAPPARPPAGEPGAPAAEDAAP